VTSSEIVTYWDNLKPLAELQIETLIASWSDVIKLYPRGYIDVLQAAVDELRAKHRVFVEVGLLASSIFAFVLISYLASDPRRSHRRAAKGPTAQVHLSRLG
jgi:hypothetical protein